MSGTLYLVSTPIGNLEDITLRALRTLREVDVVAAEDTRRARKLLGHYGIRKRLISYREYDEEARVEGILKLVRGGKNVAVVSDGGTPSISDPGYRLVRAAIGEGISVVPIPGPTALIAGLVVSGLPTDSFAFEGFLPSRRGSRIRRLEGLRGERRTLVFYEAPHRIRGTLEDMLKILGDREVALAFEITKLHEEIRRGRMSEILKSTEGEEVRGEIVLVVRGREEEEGELPNMSVRDHVLQVIREEGLPKKEAIKRVARIRGMPKSAVYRESLGDEADRLRNRTPS
ncbi:MAG: 16S rRNA (cytidine(1402)-2'-O)-methyltransferase [bacterium]